MTKRINKGVELLFLLLILFSLIGCSPVDIGTVPSGSDEIVISDETAIKTIGNNIKIAVENKDVDMFMSNISLNYSDSKGRTYDSIYAMAQSMVDKIENAEELGGSYGVNLTVSTSISKLSITSPTASSDFKITVNAKFLFFTVYSYSMDFEVIFQKENDGWKVISMIEKS